MPDFDEILLRVLGICFAFICILSTIAICFYMVKDMMGVCHA